MRNKYNSGYQRLDHRTFQIGTHGKKCGHDFQKMLVSSVYWSNTPFRYRPMPKLSTPKGGTTSYDRSCEVPKLSTLPFQRGVLNFGASL